ncbi:NucA/NucB deoxyribonuclease domain-containing protein [Rhodococcoides yunnanense]|uniref:NucA/NucB deoxyribonuclease domain-containing protein n=1 Tax=Rhodococcoides yunnanense TaxID=278209 RepID=UPI001114BF29|nr:hypothetical protein [Rhodococcus yunnanensis]
MPQETTSIAAPAQTAESTAPTVEQAPALDNVESPALTPLPAPAADEPVAPTDEELSSKTAEPDPDWTPTENPKATIVPGQMRSDREEVPAPFTKEDADKAEVAEARLRMSRNATACQIYWPSWYNVCGEIKAKYDSLGGPGSFLSYPSSGNIVNPGNTGERVTFLNGPIYWSQASGAHPVVNSFLNRWGNHQYEAGWLKYPTTDEIVLPDGGRRQEFQQGAIYVAFQNAIGSAIQNGPLRDKYNSVGGLTPGSSFLGYITEDHKRSLPNSQGQMARFQNGVIYWHPSHGAHPVTLPILDLWASEGYEQGIHGYPTGDQADTGPGTFEQNFQNGKISWPPLEEVAGRTEYEVTMQETLAEGMPTSRDLIPIYDDDNPGSQARRADIPGQPSVCIESGMKNIERTISCANYDGKVTRYETVNGRRYETGHVLYKAANWSIFTAATNFGNQNIPSWKLGTRIEATYAQGSMLAKPTDFILSTGCESSQLCETTGGGNGDTHKLQVGDITEVTWDQKLVDSAAGARGEVYQMRGLIGAKMLHGPATPWSAEFDDLEGRCDTMNVGAACVNNKAFAGVLFSPLTNPTIKTVSEHVFDAQTDLPGNPGAFPNSPLTRLTDETTIDANRNTACPNPPGAPFSCDEYPMASTYQGASLSSNYSTRTVLKSANDSQGGKMSAAYNMMRLLDGDAFFVMAQREDGTFSW